MNHYLNELGDYLLKMRENAHISVLTSLWPETQEQQSS